MAGRHTLAESLSAGRESNNRIRDALRIPNESKVSANEAALYIRDLLSAMQGVAEAANLGALREALVLAQELTIEKMEVLDPSVTISDDFLSGIPVFTGTRVPIQNLFDVLEGGENLESFLEQFPDVQRRQAIDVLRRASLSFERENLAKRVSDAHA